MSQDITHPTRVNGSYTDVKAQLAEAIHRGEWRFGDRIPAERTLAKQLAVSRMTVRRATRDLIAAGVLEVRSGVGALNGTFVRSELVPRSMLHDPTRLPIGDIAAVLEARRIFEPPVAVLAAQRATHDDIAELERTIRIQESHLDDPLRASLLDASFHIAVARATHNQTMVEMMEVLQQRLELLRRFDFRPATRLVRPAIYHHHQTLDAIVSNQPRRIEAVMDEHLAMMEHAWVEQRAREGDGIDPADRRRSRVD